MIDHYDWARGREAVMRFGPATGPVVIAALPLFEEANRTRTFVVTLLRALAARGIAGALPDLPGTGESLVATEEMSLAALHAAFAAAVAQIHAEGRAVHALAVRSGALLDLLADLSSRWHFAPIDGADLVRELDRIRLASSPGAGDAAAIEIAGNRISRRFLADLGTLCPLSAEDGPPVRVVRLESDRQPADLHVAAAPLWRRAEPDNDFPLAELLAGDVAAWVRACAG
ncbi:MAG: hypothetical protein WDN44_11190 [Sphingomonas sp.]